MQVPRSEPAAQTHGSSHAVRVTLQRMSSHISYFRKYKNTARKRAQTTVVYHRRGTQGHRIK